MPALAPPIQLTYAESDRRGGVPMQPAIVIAGILGAILIGAMSPGPSFVLVARTSIALGRRDGLAAALGMGIGGVVFGALALLGLQALLTRLAWLADGLKLAGCAYLLYLAVRPSRGAWGRITAPTPAAPRAATTPRSRSP